MSEIGAADTVNHPPHYTAHPSGIECIAVTEHYGFNVGNAIKYLWRAGLKSKDPIEDLKKAAWYVNREIERLTGAARPDEMESCKTCNHTRGAHRPNAPTRFRDSTACAVSGCICCVFTPARSANG